MQRIVERFAARAQRGEGGAGGYDSRAICRRNARNRSCGSLPKTGSGIDATLERTELKPTSPFNWRLTARAQVLLGEDAGATQSQAWSQTQINASTARIAA